MNQKPEKRVFVRGDVQSLPADTISWFPAPVREASVTLDVALARREEAEVAVEVAEDAARAAARARLEAEDEALCAGKAFPAATDSKAAERLTTALRTRGSADRVAAAAVEAWLTVLEANAEEIGALLGERRHAENLRAQQALAVVEDAIIRETALDRLGGTLRSPRAADSQPMSRRAWATPTTADTHAGLAAVAELFNIVGGRSQEAVAA
jgi:hypothetical protein